MYKKEPKIPEVLLEHLDADESRYDEGSLGEFDFYFASGWMYAVNNVFPNVGFADYYLSDDDVMRIQYTIALGSDLGGGWGSNYFKPHNKDVLTRLIAEINSGGKKEELLNNPEINRAYSNAINSLTRIDADQMELTDNYFELASLIDNESKITVESVEQFDAIEVEKDISVDDVIKLLPKTLKLHLSNETTEEVEVTWSSEDFDSTTTGKYTFISEYELPEGVTGEKVDVSIIVQVIEKEVVTSELESIISEAEELDTTGKTGDSIQVLVDAIEFGKEVLEDETKTQEQVDKAIEGTNRRTIKSSSRSKSCFGLCGCDPQ